MKQGTGMSAMGLLDHRPGARRCIVDVGMSMRSSLLLEDTVDETVLAAVNERDRSAATTFHQGKSQTNQAAS